jgi:hypothetical protein
VALPPPNVVTNNFIDNFIQICLDTNDFPEHTKHAVPLILESLFRPVDNNNNNYHDPIISMTKHQAEGQLENCKIILG